jgi:hypothetical protein
VRRIFLQGDGRTEFFRRACRRQWRGRCARPEIAIA